MEMKKKKNMIFFIIFTIIFVGIIDVDAKEICKRATVLHTEKCSNNSGGCASVGYNNGDDIIYGTIGEYGKLVPGDAFDCDVNGDGTYDSNKERFYYVTDNNSDTSVLIYSNSVSSGVANNTTKFAYSKIMDYSIYYGPDAAILQLPTTSQWPNVKLSNTIRDIKDEKGNVRVSKFSYEGYAARLLTTQEIESAYNKEVGNLSNGELDGYNFLFENTNYSNYNITPEGYLTNGYWLETPHSYGSNSAKIVITPDRYVCYQDVSYAGEGVRPVIEVAKTNIEIDKNKEENKQDEQNKNNKVEPEENKNDNNKQVQKIKIENTKKNISFIGYIIGTIIFALGIFAIYQSIRKNNSK